MSSIDEVLLLPYGQVEKAIRDRDNETISSVLVTLYKHKTLIKSRLEDVLSLKASPFIKNRIQLNIFDSQETYLSSKEYLEFKFHHYDLYHAFLAQLEILLGNFNVFGRTGSLELNFEDDVTNTFGSTSPAQARYYRKRAFLTKEEAATLLNTSSTNIESWELGAKCPSTCLKKYASYFKSAHPDLRVPQSTQNSIYSFSLLQFYFLSLISDSSNYYGTI